MNTLNTNKNINQKLKIIDKCFNHIFFLLFPKYFIFISMTEQQYDNYKYNNDQNDSSYHYIECTLV